MVKIRAGKLVLPKGYADLYELSDALLKPPCGPKTDDEPVAVATSVMEPCAIPHAVMTCATQETGGFVNLFWAEDEDNGGQEVLIAWDTKLTEKKFGQPEDTNNNEDEEERWFIVEEGRWIQAPSCKEFVRLFRNKTDAIRCIGDCEFVVVPVDTISGWKTVIVDGKYELNFSDFRDHPDFDELIGIPDGFEIGCLLETRDVKLGEVLKLIPDEATGIADYCVERIIVTSTGEVFIAASTSDSFVGQKIIGRKFTHEEAKKLHL